MKKTTYLDNAATTAVHPEVAKEIAESLQKFYGNPSSIHSLGRQSRAQIELARKKIAGCIGASPAEIIFTSGGTEADNMAIHHAVKKLKVKHIISSTIEHTAVLNACKYYSNEYDVDLHLISPDQEGLITKDRVAKVLESIPSGEKILISLMHTNNEVGNITDIKAISSLKSSFPDLIIHSDTVQALSYEKVNVAELGIDYLACSGHKLYGPKGVGFLYASTEFGMSPLIIGGGQERGFRGGTEPIGAISGLAKAFEILHNDQAHIDQLNHIHQYAVSSIKEQLPGTLFNSNLENCAPTILNIQLNSDQDASMLLFNYDLSGICVSGGSACTSGSNKGSHVLEALGAPSNKPSIRISFSSNTTQEDIDHFIEVTKQML